MIYPEVAAFFADFAVDATVGGVVCRGIFEDNYSEALDIVSGTTPVLLVEESVVASSGTAVTIDTKSYTVRNIKPDGAGCKNLFLEAA